MALLAVAPGLSLDEAWATRADVSMLMVEAKAKLVRMAAKQAGAGRGSAGRGEGPERRPDGTVAYSLHSLEDLHRVLGRSK